MSQQAIPYMQIRGGTSKGIYFNLADLPKDQALRDEWLLYIVGRDKTQIDGLGGGVPLTSKVAIINPSTQEGCDIDYLFVQVVVGENRVDSTPNCGNILAGVGAYAIESGLLKAKADSTTVVVNMLNSDTKSELIISTPKGEVSYSGDTYIDGVLAPSAPVICNYLGVEGAICGSLFPTGNHTDKLEDNLADHLEGVEVTCIDNGMPVVILRANDMGITGYERPEELNANTALKDKLEAIRLQAGELMHLGDVKQKVIPKMCMVSPPKQNGHISVRSFIPHYCHSAIGVLAAVSIARACLYETCVTEGIAKLDAYSTGHDGSWQQSVDIEHPCGFFTVHITLDERGEVIKMGVIRTARLIAKGHTYIPHELVKRERGEKSHTKERI